MSHKRKAAGRAAYEKKIGIHGLKKEVKREIAKKGNVSFLARWKLQEYRELHRNRIRLGKLVQRFHKAYQQLREKKAPFGFY